MGDAFHDDNDDNNQWNGVFFMSYGGLFKLEPNTRNATIYNLEELVNIIILYR